MLIGDSGEQDPEVYGDIARRYPSQICRILIRNVDDTDAEHGRYYSAFKDIASNKWQVFDVPQQITVSELLDCI
ncbi:phosphatase domain-containing protein [Kaarinaea lacus]